MSFFIRVFLNTEEFPSFDDAFHFNIIVEYHHVTSESFLCMSVLSTFEWRFINFPTKKNLSVDECVRLQTLNGEQVQGNRTLIEFSTETIKVNLIGVDTEVLLTPHHSIYYYLILVLFFTSI